MQISKPSLYDTRCLKASRAVVLYEGIFMNDVQILIACWFLKSLGSFSIITISKKFHTFLVNVKIKLFSYLAEYKSRSK